jgi:hypothetical protein
MHTHNQAAHVGDAGVHLVSADGICGGGYRAWRRGADHVALLDSCCGHLHHIRNVHLQRQVHPLAHLSTQVFCKRYDQMLSAHETQVALTPLGRVPPPALVPPVYIMCLHAQCASTYAPGAAELFPAAVRHRSACVQAYTAVCVCYRGIHISVAHRRGAIRRREDAGLEGIALPIILAATLVLSLTGVLLTNLSEVSLETPHVSRRVKCERERERERDGSHSGFVASSG